MQVEQELDFHCLYGLADQDGPLRSEVRIGFSKWGSLADEIKAAQTWRSARLRFVMQFGIQGRPAVSRLRVAVQNELSRQGFSKKEGAWWVVEPSKLIDVTVETAGIEFIKTRTPADVETEFEAALRRKMQGVLK